MAHVLEFGTDKYAEMDTFVYVDWRLTIAPIAPGPTVGL